MSFNVTMQRHWRYLDTLASGLGVIEFNLLFTGIGEVAFIGDFNKVISIHRVRLFIHDEGGPGWDAQRYSTNTPAPGLAVGPSVAVFGNRFVPKIPLVSPLAIFAERLFIEAGTKRTKHVFAGANNEVRVYDYRFFPDAPLLVSPEEDQFQYFFIGDFSNITRHRVSAEISIE